MLNVEGKMQNTECKSLNAERRTLNPKRRMLNLPVGRRETPKSKMQKYFLVNRSFKISE